MKNPSSFKQFSSGDGMIYIKLEVDKGIMHLYALPEYGKTNVTLKGEVLGKFIAWLKEEGFKG